MLFICEYKSCGISVKSLDFYSTFQWNSFFMFVTHFNERIVIKTVKWISYDSLPAAYISQLAICSYAGHMTERLSTRMGTAGQGSSWINTTCKVSGSVPHFCCTFQKMRKNQH